MNRLTISVLVLGTAIAAGCGQRLLDFYNDHDDAGVQDMARKTDLNGVDMNGVDLSVGDMGEEDMNGNVDMHEEDMTHEDFDVPADLLPECVALHVPGSGAIAVAGPGTPDFYTPISTGTPAGALTVEAWIYQTTAGDSVIAAHTGDAGTSTLGWVLSTTASGALSFQYSSDGVTYAARQSLGGLVPTATWTHVAGEYTPQSGIVPASLDVYINGTNVDFLPNGIPSTATAAINIPLSVGGLTGASSSAATSSFTGYIHDVRVSNTVRYTAAFTPAKQLLSDSSTLALFTYEDALGSVSFADTVPMASLDFAGQGSGGAVIATQPVCLGN